MENCIKCNQVECIQCQIGFKLIQNQCISICGDKILISEYEECDDGNDIQYDGCYECKYQCNITCQNCINGICKDQCQFGEVFINQQCQSVCGNLITTGYEECDDGNDIQHDGCYKCQYSCPLFCENCELGICLGCYCGLKVFPIIFFSKLQQDYIIKNNKCTSLELCGNGQVGDLEECDDGNLIANDGCYQCQVEQNWLCKNSNPSQCFYMEAPYIILTFLNQTSEIQFTQLTFSQQVKISNIEYSFNESIKLTIQNVSQYNYNITIYPVQEMTNYLSLAKYDIEILITESLIPILEVELDDNIVITNENIIIYLLIFVQQRI